MPDAFICDALRCAPARRAVESARLCPIGRAGRVMVATSPRNGARARPAFVLERKR